MLILFSCNTGNDEPETTKEEVIEKTENSEAVISENKSETVSGNFEQVANPVMYTALVKSTPDEEVPEEWLANMNIKSFSDIVFEAIYSEKVKAFRYMDTIPMTIEEVKEFEKEYPRDRIGKVFFNENWSVDKDNLSIEKKVNSFMFAYERISDEGEIQQGYKSGVVVYLNKTKPELQ